MRNIDVSASSRLRAVIRERVRMYDNDWMDQLEAEIKKQFHEKTAPKVLQMADTSQNIFRRIVRDICTVYKQPSTRTIKDADELTQKQANSLFSKLKLDRVMDRAYKYSKAATASFVLVRPVGDRPVVAEGQKDPGQRMVLRVLTPEQVHVETDPEDPSRMTTFGYLTSVVNAKGKTVNVWIFYTDEERWFADESGKGLDVDPRTGFRYDTENTLGLIPAVCFPSDFQIRTFWDENCNRDASEANLKIGLFYTYLNYLVKTQSFKQITIGADKVPDEMADAILDPLFPLLLGGGARAETIDLNTRLEAVNEVIRGRVESIANNYGISRENFSLTRQATSGFALKIANQPLQDIREADIPLCAHVEQELYRIIATISGVLDPEAEIGFNPGEVTWPEEWTTMQARWEFEFKNGISSPVDYVISQDPQKTREEAMAEILKRQEEMKILRPKVSAWDMLLGASTQGGAAPAGDGAPSPLLAAAAAAQKPADQAGAA